MDEDDLRHRIGGNRGGRSDSNSLIDVEIRNWEGGSKEDLIRFIQKKSQIRLQRVYISGGILHASVKEHEGTLIKKHSGIRFAGASLDIQIPGANNNSGRGGGPSKEAQNAVQLLETYLRNHYLPEQQLLNLDNMKHDPFLIENGLMASASTSSKMFPALMKVGSLNIPNVESVSLANNGFTDIVFVTTLAATYPNLKNLSLANNAIAKVRGLENWRHKFPYLRELILAGNPIANEPTYKADMIKLFPRLIMLDGQVVQDASQIDTPRLPVPVKQNFFENPEVQSISGNFLTPFFDLYDRDRSQLLQLYDSHSTFSLNVNTIAPKTLVPGAPPGWGEYISQSRNLSKITSTNARVSRLAIGPDSIASVFQRLPATKHDLKNPAKFSLDAWKVSSVRAPNDQGIMVFVHGEFEEAPEGWVRSFDRSLVLIPGPVGNMIVSSDMLTLRPYGGCDAWKESSVNQQQQQPANIPPQAAPSGDIPDALKALSPEQQLVVKNLMQETRLNAEFALMCAQQAQFNYQQAFELFQHSHASNSIPSNAFM